MDIPRTGKFKCSIEDYNAYPAARNTLLKILIDQSPAHYLHALEAPKEPTPAKILGSAVHLALLEPKFFKEQLKVVPIFEGYTQKGELTTNMNCKEVKEKAERWHLANHGKTIVTQEQLDHIAGMRDAISKHTRAAQLMSDGHAEESLFWTDSETKIQCKARPDFLREGHIIVDVKSTDDASYRSFQKDIANFGYHFQAAMYLDAATSVLGGHFDTFIIVAVESKPPYAVQCFRLDEASIRDGQQLYYAALKKLKPCLESGIYPAYGNELIPIAIPTYAIRGEP